MGAKNLFKDQQSHALTKKLLPWALYAFVPLIFIRLYLYPIPLLQSLTTQEDFPNTPIASTSQRSQEDLQDTPIIITTTTSFSPPSQRRKEDIQATPISATVSTSATSPPVQEQTLKSTETPCDYFTGKWVHDKLGPLYNGTTCRTIKDGQNCISHGRPDMGYLYWRWRPNQCKLPRFNPATFFELHKNKHLAFIGDSMARNQLESLLCLLSSVTPPDLVYTNGEENKFRRWNFPSHNINVSIYWSPFLVKGMEKSSEFKFNKLFLESVDNRWADDMEGFDLIVLSIGHWFLHPAVYYNNDVLLGCHYCPELNHTEIGFYDVFRKAFNTTLKAIADRKSGKGVDVIVTTFSPAHFEGEWDKAGACPKKSPYKAGEKELEWMDTEMRKIEVEEVNKAKEHAYASKLTSVRFEALDITKLSNMRADSHPGPYMNPFPFANGAKDRVQNDCVHWCLPGAIDTWNEILLEVVKRWDVQSSRAS